MFVITTVDSDRYKAVKNHLLDNNICFDVIVAPSHAIIDKSIRNYKSHPDNTKTVSLSSAFLSILETSIINNYNVISILEDDILLVNGWEQKFKQFYENICNTWDIINCSNHPENSKVSKFYNQYAEIVTSYWTAHFSILKHTVFKKLKEYVLTENYILPMDYYHQLIYNDDRFVCFTPIEVIALQQSYRPYFTDRKIFNSVVHKYNSLLY